MWRSFTSLKKILIRYFRDIFPKFFLKNVEDKNKLGIFTNSAVFKHFSALESSKAVDEPA
jgi:hypothetical protein